MIVNDDNKAMNDACPASHSVNQSVGKDLNPAIRIGDVFAHLSIDVIVIGLLFLVCCSSTIFMLAREVSLR